MLQVYPKEEALRRLIAKGNNKDAYKYAKLGMQLYASRPLPMHATTLNMYLEKTIQVSGSSSMSALCC